jgi:hypothetical protein
MKGIVRFISTNRIRVAVQTEYGYTVFDVEDGEFTEGDIVSGNLDDHGGQVVANESKRQRAFVCIEAVQADLVSAQSLCRRCTKRR